MSLYTRITNFISRSSEFNSYRIIKEIVRILQNEDLDYAHLTPIIRDYDGRIYNGYATIEDYQGVPYLVVYNYTNARNRTIIDIDELNYARRNRVSAAFLNLVDIDDRDGLNEFISQVRNIFGLDIVDMNSISTPMFGSSFGKHAPLSSILRRMQLDSSIIYGFNTSDNRQGIIEIEKETHTTCAVYVRYNDDPDTEHVAENIQIDFITEYIFLHYGITETFILQN